MWARRCGVKHFCLTRRTQWEQKRPVKADGRSAARSVACGPRFVTARIRIRPSAGRCGVVCLAGISRVPFPGERLPKLQAAQAVAFQFQRPFLVPIGSCAASGAVRGEVSVGYQAPGRGACRSPYRTPSVRDGIRGVAVQTAPAHVGSLLAGESVIIMVPFVGSFQGIRSK